MSESKKQLDVLSKPFKPDDAQAQADEEMLDHSAQLRLGLAEIPPAPPPGTNLEGALELAAWQKHRQRQRLQHKE